MDSTEKRMHGYADTVTHVLHKGINT